jgi:hypothetical protein
MTVSDDDISALLNEELLARRTKVMFLRNAGATWDAIAKETGVSAATCRKDYAVVCRDINAEQPVNVVARHRAVIFDIQRANYARMMRGDKDAALVIIRALDREAKLLGLDAPTRILAGVSDVEFANEAARLIERITQLDPSTLKELQRGQGLIDAEAEHVVIDAELAETTVAGQAPKHEPSGAELVAEGERSDPEPPPALAVAGPYRPGQPVRDPSADGDGGDAGQAGHARRAEGGQDQALPEQRPATPPEDDDDWSNL